MSVAVKRSSRPVRITQRLAESIKQQESFGKKDAKTKTHDEKPTKETLAQVLKRKRENLVEVMNNMKVDIRECYSLKDLRVMDGPTLTKLFAQTEITENGLHTFKCCFAPNLCEKSFTKASEQTGHRLICGHLLEHVLIHAKKSLKNPGFYSRKRYYPASSKAAVKTEIAETIIPEQPLRKKSRKRTVLSDPLNFVDLPVVQADSLLQANGDKDALLTAVSLCRNKTSGGKKSSRRINTRLNRKKVTEEKQETMHQKQKEKLLKRFRNQPKVMVEDFAVHQKILEAQRIRLERQKVFDQRGSVANFLSRTAALEEDVVDTNDEVVGLQADADNGSEADDEGDIPADSDSDEDGDIPADSDSTDSDKTSPAKLMSVTKNLLASLPPKKAKPSIPPRMKRVPSILRRVRKSTNTAPLVLNNSSAIPSTFPEIKIESYSSIREEDESQSINVVDSDSPPSPVSINNDDDVGETRKDVDTAPLNDDRDGNNSDSSSDMASDSSVWNSEEEQKQVTPKKAPRKQILVSSKNENSENNDLLFHIHHDHCYIDKEKAFDFSKFVKQNSTKLLSRLAHKTNRAAGKHPNKSKEVIKVLSKGQTTTGNEYRLRGPSSTKIETSTDPKIRARALKLIAELRHRKPKEVMVCTERIVSDGQSSFIVQDFYTCEICGKRFTAPNSLYGHYRGHAGIKPFRCDVCGKTFTRSHSLSYHAMIHTNSARFECEYCKRRFRHPTHYKEHLHRHTGEEPYHCTDCPRRFKTRNTYRRHMIAKHGKKITPMGSIAYTSRVIKPE